MSFTESNSRTSFYLPPIRNIDDYGKIKLNPESEKLPDAFRPNQTAKYSMPTKWNKNIDIGDLSKLEIFVRSEKDSFQSSNLNIFTNYMLTFYNDGLIQKWLSKCDMSFYQNQLNFAVWCSSSGCGVSIQDHLNPRPFEPLIPSVFKFHIYYQTRKILEEMGCPIPGESIFNSEDNKIDLVKYQKLCNEFNIPVNTDFRFKGGDNGGLGTMYNYSAISVWRQHPGESAYRKDPPGYYPFLGYYNPKIQQFVSQSSGSVIKIDYIVNNSAKDGWKQFMLEKSEGFTKAGITRIDDSIRTYVYCILGAQALTRSSILTSPETQQYFTNLLEQNIKSLFSIPESIAQYEDSITKTNSKINFAIGVGLYMIPADMVLKIGSIEKYNNNILIAPESTKIGLNENLNSLVVQPNPPDLQTNIHKEKIPDINIVKTPINYVQSNNMYIAIGISAIVFSFLAVFYRKK
jgi:hypothetical protein